MAADDYPALPVMPAVAGTIDAHDLARAVAQVSIAASRDDTLPLLTSVQIEVEGRMTNTEIAKKVIDALGGRENVSSVAHCATRLRVMVKDEAKINKDVVENLEKVQGAFFNSGQYQIIFGTGTVNKIYDEVVALGLPTSSKDDMKAEAAKQGNWFQRAIRTFGDVFVPIIPVIVATGLFMGVRGLLNALGVTLPEDIKVYSEILTDTASVDRKSVV